MALWGARFSDNLDDLVLNYTESLSYDRRLYAHDIQGSIAHVKMLEKSGIITVVDADNIVKELTAIREEIARDDFTFDTGIEDLHMQIENALIDRLGDTGARLHTARSRNDQIATDIRLYLRDEIDLLRTAIKEMQSRLVLLADSNPDAIMPGLTHLQNAQPILFAHHLLAYVEMLSRDESRLVDCRRRMNQLPLGAGALSGSSLPIDRQHVADQLQFDGIMRNSMDAVSARDFVIELLADLAIVMMHLSRFCEDVILWTSHPCRYIELEDRFCTGSSLMPQKKNPDIAELTRGKTGRVYGALISLLTIMKGLPLCYNRDMQEDKEPVFDAVDTVKMALIICARMLHNVRVNKERMRQAASDPGMMATDLVEWLVAQGIPFRVAYKKVGSLVAYSLDQGNKLDELSLHEMQAIIPEATKECLTIFNPHRSVQVKTSFGGTAPIQVMAQLAYWKKELNLI